MSGEQTGIDRFAKAYVEQYPENLVKYVPPVIMALGTSGTVGPWLAIGAIFMAQMLSAARTAYSSAGQAARDRQVDEEFEAVREKLRAFQRAVDEASPGISSDQYEARAAELRATLSDQQKEQVGMILEEYVRAADERWLEHLRAAVRGTIGGSGSVASATRKVVLSHLSSLSHEHLTSLRRLMVVGKGGYYGLSEKDPLTGQELMSPEIESALVSVGFIEHERVDGGLNAFVYARSCCPTPLGKAALELLSA